MTWETHRGATDFARKTFSAMNYRPRVLWNGEELYVIEPTPFGRVGLVGVREGFVVAAERPPESLILPGRLPKRLFGYFQAQGLRPWKLVVCRDLSEAIRSLVAPPPEQPAESPIRYLCPIPSAAELVGESRQRCGELLAGAVAARQFPLVQLVGIDGIGKRTLLAVAAAEHRWALRGELPLGRLLIDRVLQTPLEGFLDSILGLGGALSEKDLLVVSDAELIAATDREARALVLRELARLPHVVLAARRRAVRLDGVISLDCPALESIDDVRTLVGLEHAEVVFAGAAFDLLVRAAMVEGTGVIPGRLLYLIRLAKALLSGHANHTSPEPTGDPSDAESPPDVPHRGEQEEAVLAPDEVTAAIELARPAWNDETEGR